MKHKAEHTANPTCNCHAKYEEARIVKKVDDAINKLLLLKSQRDWALWMCRKDEAKFDRFLGLC